VRPERPEDYARHHHDGDPPGNAARKSTHGLPAVNRCGRQQTELERDGRRHAPRARDRDATKKPGDHDAQKRPGHTFARRAARGPERPQIQQRHFERHREDVGVKVGEHEIPKWKLVDGSGNNP
jgi:hypothetical protein